jgi:hypothetical protein
MLGRCHNAKAFGARRGARRAMAIAVDYTHHRHFSEAPAGQKGKPRRSGAKCVKVRVMGAKARSRRLPESLRFANSFPIFAGHLFRERPAIGASRGAQRKSPAKRGKGLSWRKFKMKKPPPKPHIAAVLRRPGGMLAASYNFRLFD